MLTSGDDFFSYQKHLNLALRARFYGSRGTLMERDCSGALYPESVPLRAENNAHTTPNQLSKSRENDFFGLKMVKITLIGAKFDLKF